MPTDRYKAFRSFESSAVLLQHALKLNDAGPESRIHGGLICTGDQFITEQSGLAAVRTHFPKAWRWIWNRLPLNEPASIKYLSWASASSATRPEARPVLAIPRLLGHDVPNALSIPRGRSCPHCPIRLLTKLKKIKKRKKT